MVNFKDYDLDEIISEIYYEHVKYYHGEYDIDMNDLSREEMLDLAYSYINEFDLEYDMLGDDEYDENNIENIVLQYIEGSNIEAYFYGYMKEYIADQDNYYEEDYDIAI